MADRESSSLPDYWAIFEFQDSNTCETFSVSLATLLQCLCIAEQRHIVPPFEAEWEVKTIPPSLREMSDITVS